MDAIDTNYWAKPIPIRQFDWSAHYDNEEPNDDGQMDVGYGRTEADAVVDLIENYPRGVQCERDTFKCPVCGLQITRDETPCDLEYGEKCGVLS